MPGTKAFFTQTLVTGYILISASLHAQVHRDTVYSFSKDTMAVRYFDINNKKYKEVGYSGGNKIAIRKYDLRQKITKEINYDHGTQTSVKRWHYNKDSFGYIHKVKNESIPDLFYSNEYYSNSKLKYERTYTRGRTGIFKSYYISGRPLWTNYLVKGKLDSTQVMQVENGEFCTKRNYRNGKLDGITSMYHVNGKLWREVLYKEGKAMEVLNIYNVNGNPVEKGTLKNGNGTILLYDDGDNVVDTAYFKNGKQERVKKKSKR